MVKRYFHGDTIEGFLAMHDAQIVGYLTTAHTSLHASLQGLQADVWREEIALLKDILTQYIGRGHIYFEYTIPRMGRRIDVVLLLDGVVLLLEFKAFNEQYSRADIAQVWDYALDLKNNSKNKSRMLWLGVSYNFNSFKQRGGQKSENDRSLIRLGM